MTLREYAPHGRPQTERLRQELKNNIPITGAIAVPAQRGKAQRVRSVVGQVEAAFQ